jgi:hypothetical protein
MKVKNFSKLGYLETKGGPICICNPTNWSWNGSLTSNGDYWKAIELIHPESGKMLKYEKDYESYWIFNNENGGFYLFKNESNVIVIVEIIYLDEEIEDWRKIEFEILGECYPDLDIRDGLMVFDSSFAITDLPKSQGFHKNVDSANYFYKNNNSYKKCSLIRYINEEIHLEGIMLEPF